jgi:hypothetical protein
MGQSHSQYDYIKVDYSHPLHDQCWKVMNTVLPNMKTIFGKSHWVLEGLLVDKLDFTLKDVTMLSISKFTNKDKTKKIRLEIDFVDKKIYYVRLQVDLLHMTFKDQLVRKMHVEQLTKLKCPQKNHVIKCLLTAILQNHY